MRLLSWLLATILLGSSLAAADANDSYVKKATWTDSMIATLEAMAGSERPSRPIPPLNLFTPRDFSVMAWVKTNDGGTILALSRPEDKWLEQGKTFFIDGSRIGMDIGWVGYAGGNSNVSDGKWHHVALTQESGRQTIYVDGKSIGSGQLEVGPTPAGAVYMLGYTSPDFPRGRKYFKGQIDEVRIFSIAVESDVIAQYAAGDVPSEPDCQTVAWTFDRDAEEPTFQNEGAKFEDGHTDAGLTFDGKSRVVLGGKVRNQSGKVWLQLQLDFTDETSTQEMAWEKEDGIWDAWTPGHYRVLAQAYASAVKAEYQEEAGTLARTADDLAAVRKVRDLYLQDRRQRRIDALLSQYNLPAMRKMVKFLGAAHGDDYDAQEHLPAIAAAAQEVLDGKLDGDALETRLKKLRYEALFRDNPQVDFEEVIFIKRQTYNGNHYYTEFINGQHRGGGNICVLNLKSGEVREIVKGLPEDGVFRRFDLSFDGKRIVFAWKKSWEEGYRIWECNVDGTGLRQLTFPPEREADLHTRFQIAGYHHGTDDMDPCYLPNGQIAFISTRCQYGILCDQPDIFTTTTLYKIDADGSNMVKLSNSSVSEATPTVMPDGRILYTRWEYVDKGSSCVKCLWSMKPDGSASSEVYGNDIATPPTMIFGRAIPNAPNKYVMLGSPHCCPWTIMGTVIRVNMNKKIRTREPMEYMTPHVDVRGLGGEARLVYMKDGKWTQNINGPIYREPTPLSETLYMVPYKPPGQAWHEPNGFGLAMLDENGDTVEFYRDADISCWQPMPFIPRVRPRESKSNLNPQLAQLDKAICIITNVHHGMDDVPQGTVKYIRILEQRPRPWASRRYWGGDSGYGQQHVVTTRFTHLGLKVQHGVVPVEDDGSASFYVPARSNMFFQALDDKFRSIQTERTLVNYMPGEIRSCVGCHETPDNAAPKRAPGLVKATRRAPSVPGPQPGDQQGGKIIDFRTMVQPVLNEHCVECHSGKEPKADMDLSDTPTDVFNVAYESLLNHRVCGKINNEVGPKTGNAEYQPPYTFGSYSSILAAMYSDGEIQLADPKANQRAQELAEKHKKVNLPLEARIRIWNWIDTNCQFYGSYWGRRNLQYKDHANYRPISTFEQSRSNVCPIPEDQR